ncbi:DUF6427 family protein [Tamlana sp. 2_MG-2023]|uniref:DUF6427 family protein n=1 Tax=unclassified Tamlana TaxID=2614803 RepID=UPI0026E2CE57|nr:MULTISPECIES: DUF6427 family protein [unclassified Tamlana]MDO6759764.1 DUF6427 family protein [Tamlana sp. 2_MG-2023]MDO6791387.1 DUF6427 family protein [Tamlana sp. 1_MG-2023]
MLTSFFNKSRPINFIIVFFITLLAFAIPRLNVQFDTLEVIDIVKQVAMLLTIYASILLINFIANKNSLTETNHFEILLFSLFLLFLPQTTNYGKVIFSNFFVLLGLRRIISLRSQKEVKKKLFDAAFWIAIAALFYFWSILFFALIILSLALYTDNNLRHWVIPFLGVFAVVLIGSATSVVVYDSYFEIFNLSSIKLSYDFSPYNSLTYLIAITLLVSFGVWSSFYYLKNIKKKKKVFRVSFKTIVLAAIIGFLIVILAPEKNGSEFLFVFMPLAIILASYIEIIQEKWFKEIFLAVLILVPFILLLL